MVKLIIFLSLTIPFFGNAQIDFGRIEQLTFDIYKDSILKKYPVGKRMRIPEYAIDFYPSIIESNLDIMENDSIELIYDMKKLNFDDYSVKMKYSNETKKAFKVRKLKVQKYPYISLALPYKTFSTPNEVYSRIIENRDSKTRIIYKLKFDDTWNLVKWERTKEETIIVY